MPMMTYLCEHCGSKFKSFTNWISKPCQNIDPNGFECGFPIAPILSLQISGIEKEKEYDKMMDDFDREDREHKQFIDYFDVSDDPGYQRYIDFCKVCGPDYDCSCNIVDCSGLSDSDIEQVKKVLAGRNK